MNLVNGRVSAGSGNGYGRVVDTGRFAHHRDEDGGETRVELRSCLLLDFFQGVFDRQRIAVRPVGGHRVEGVDDREDACRERDLDSPKPVRVAGAVPALVVRGGDPRGGAVQVRNLGEDPLAEGDVSFHQSELLTVELAGLEQDRVGHADLSDVVEEEAVLELGVVHEIGSDPLGEAERQLRDSSCVRAGLVVAQLEHGRQGANGRAVRVLHCTQRRVVLDCVADRAVECCRAHLALDEEVGGADARRALVDLAVVGSGEQDDGHLVSALDQLAGEVDTVLCPREPIVDETDVVDEPSCCLDRRVEVACPVQLMDRHLDLGEQVAGELVVLVVVLDQQHAAASDHLFVRHGGRSSTGGRRSRTNTA